MFGKLLRCRRSVYMVLGDWVHAITFNQSDSVIRKFKRCLELSQVIRHDDLLVFAVDVLDIGGRSLNT